MKIGIDISVTRRNQAGTAIYTSNLVDALLRTDRENTYELLAAGQKQEMSKRKTIGSRLSTLYHDLFWIHGLLPWQARKARLDVLHMPSNITPIMAPCPIVLTILDTTVLRMPEYFNPWQRNYFKRFLPLSARKAAAILTISEHSKRDIISYLNVPPEKIFVTYLGAQKEFQPARQEDILRLKERYGMNSFILTVGTLEPRKNLSRLLKAFSKCRQSGVSHHLIHAGPPGWMVDQLSSEIKDLNLTGVVHFTGRISLEDLATLYSAATLFVYPSLYEGFGLPVLEAMSCGTPVITSSVSSLPEVLGNAGILIDPLNVDELAEAMLHLVGDSTLRETLIQKGLRQARNFSWEKCATETLSVYRQIASK